MDTLAGSSRPKTLQEWQDLFNDIYGEKNKRLDTYKIWMHVVEEVGEVARQLRKENYDELRKSLPDVFAWLCAFCNHRSIKLEEAVWYKFPAICPFCGRESRCICIAESYPSYEPARWVHYRNRRERRPVTMQDWYNMFKEIYGNVNRIVMTPSVGFHLMEEIGEMAKQLRRDTPSGYEEGVSDVFAWLIALTMKLPQIGMLDEATWALYPGVCKLCSKRPCDCSITIKEAIRV